MAGTSPTSRVAVLLAVLGRAGRLLRWIGAALILASPVILMLNADRLGEVARQLALGLLAWAALCLAWSLVSVGLRHRAWRADP